MQKILLFVVLSASLKSLTDERSQTYIAKTNQKVAEEMKIVTKFAKESRRTYKDMQKQSGLSKSDLDKIKTAEKLNLKLLEETENSIKKIEAN